MISAIRPRIPIRRFPTSKHDYTVITPMMLDAYEIVANEVEKMETGISLHSTSRYGKTRALRYVTERFYREKPSVTVVNVIMTTRKMDSDRKFFAHLMSSFFPEDGVTGDGDDIRSRLAQLMLIRCSEKEDSRVLMLIDEAQRLSGKHFSYLIDLTNHLEMMGVAPTVILTGQPELLDLRTELLRTRRRDAVGRFMESPIQFEGVLNKQTLAKILVQYDDFNSIAFPAGSQVCITQAYVPRIFKNGFRLERAAAPFWEAISDAAGHLRVPPSIGMQSLTKTIEMALIEISAVDEEQLILSKAWWSEVLHASGYLSHLLTVSETVAS